MEIGGRLGRRDPAPRPDEVEQIGIVIMRSDLYRAAQSSCSIPSEYGPESNYGLDRRTLGTKNNIFHVAARYNNHKFIIKALARREAAAVRLLRERNSKCETPLHIAAQLGCLETVRVILPLSSQPDPEAPEDLLPLDNDNESPLHKALKTGHDRIAMLLLGRYGQWITIARYNNLYQEVAYLAAYNHCYESLRKILGLTANNQRGVPRPLNPKIYHSAWKLTDDFMHLIKKMDPSLLREYHEDGKTILHHAVEENKPLMVITLLRIDCTLACLHDRKNEVTPLDAAFKEGIFPIVKIILEMSPQSVDTVNKKGKTCLHHANMDDAFLAKLRTIDTRIMDSLINQVDADGNTVLHLALNESKQDAASKLLWLNGCDWGLMNHKGQSPFDICKSKTDISRRSEVYNMLSSFDGRQQRPQRTWISSLKQRLYRFYLEEEQLESLLNKSAVAAALLIPLNFTAAFSVPGGYDNKTGRPVLRDKYSFKVYSISNMTAFFATMVILISCTFGIGKRLNKRKLAYFSIVVLQLALAATISAYSFGIVAIGGLNSGLPNKISFFILPSICVIVSLLLIVAM